MTERILIAGCGDLGADLGAWLAQAGHEVYGLRRRPEPLPAPLNTLQADLTQADSLRSIPRDWDVVYFIATPGAYNEAAYRRTYIDGLNYLLRHLNPSALRRLVVVSSTSVYHQNQGEWVDETSPTEPSSFSGQTVLAMEGIALAHPASPVVLRFGGIYGPGRERMLRKVKNGEACADNPPQYTNRIHRDDAVGMLRHVHDSEIPPGVYLGVDDTPCSQCELMDYLAGELGLPTPARANAADKPTKAGSKRCRNDKIKATGYQCRYPSYRDGYAGLL